MHKSLVIPKDRIAEFCRQYHIQRLCVFGSALSEDFRADSDVDVLVEFERGYTPGFSFFGMESELSQLLGRKVDLSTPGFLSSYFREDVIKTAEVVYQQN